MLKRGRAVPMCFPTLFFACLLLTTCGTAQGGVRLQRVEISANDPVRILQILLESQRVLTRDDQRIAPRVSGAGNWVSRLAVLVKKESPQGASASPWMTAVAASDSDEIAGRRPSGDNSSAVMAAIDPALWSGMTPGKIFGIGAQSAH